MAEGAADAAPSEGPTGSVMSYALRNSLNFFTWYTFCS